MVSKDVLKTLVSKLGQVFDKNIQIHLADGNYHLPSVPEVKEILDDDDVNLRKYVPERLDCVSGDSPVIIKIDGVVMVKEVSSLSRILEENKDVLILDGKNKFTKLNWARLVNTVKDTYRVYGNSVIDATGDHKINFSLDGKEGYCPIDEYEDSVIGSVLHPEEHFKEEYNYSYSMGYAMGLFFTDGYANEFHTPGIDRYEWKISNTNLEYLNKAKTALEKEFPHLEFNIKNFKSEWKSNYHRTKLLYNLIPNSKQVMGARKKFILEWLDFYNDSRRKTVPDRILKSNPECIVGFIEGAFDGNGTKIGRPQDLNISLNSKTSVLGLSILVEKLYKKQVVISPDNASYKLSRKMADIFDPRKIRIRETEHNPIMYDLNTESGSFCCGTFDVHNCDDYALLLKAEFVVRQNMYRKESPYCFGEIWGEFPTPHAINIFIDNNHQVWFVEPQTDEIFPLSERIKSIWMIKI